jgi:hypothetical protein
MDKEKSAEMRLEILKLVHRNDHKPQEVIARAEEFEKYVLKEASEAPQEPEAKSVTTNKGGAKNKKEDNPLLA